MTSIRIGDYLHHDDAAVRAAAKTAQHAVAVLLRTVRDANDTSVDDEPRPGRRVPSARGTAKAIRAWARDHGYQLNSMGRIPADVSHAYHAAHGGRS